MLPHWTAVHPQLIAILDRWQLGNLRRGSPAIRSASRSDAGSPKSGAPRDGANECWRITLVSNTRIWRGWSWGRRKQVCLFCRRLRTRWRSRLGISCAKGSILLPMTDKEIAIALGELILELRCKESALSSILDSVVLQDGSLIPWETMQDREMKRLQQSQILREKYASLRQRVLDQENPESLLETLYTFVKASQK